jgi:hypothetical protein
MKRIIVTLVMFLSFTLNSQVYINGKKVAETGSNDISIVNGDVYIDGKSIDELTEDVEETETTESEETSDPTVYETENVDAYNKWYNAKGKKIMEKEKKETKKAFILIIGSIGAVLVFITLGFVFAEIRKRIRDRRSRKIIENQYNINRNPAKEYPLKSILEPETKQEQTQTGLTEIPSAIKKK